MSGFEWISALVEWFGKFFPHQLILSPTEAAVKFKRGRTPVLLSSGIHWYLPLLSKVETVSIARQAENLRSQTLVTTDDQAVIVSGILVHEVVDPVTFTTTSFDGFTTLKELTLTAIHDVVSQLSWEELKVEQRSGKLDTKLRNATKRLIDEYGVKVLKVMLTDLAKTRVLKIVTATSQD